MSSDAGEQSMVPAGEGQEGSLILVATPIGNLGEMSPRATQILAGAAIVYAEDTRRTLALLRHLGIADVRLRSLHAHNEAQRCDEIVARVQSGQVVAVVSDAGMPGINDPGARAVRSVADAGGLVSVVSGPSSVMSAVALSGFGGDRFVHEGFLPRSGRERSARLAQIMCESRPVVVFESPRRLAATLRDLAERDATRPAVVVRELSKMFEEVWRASLADLATRAGAAEVRGEIVIVISAASEAVAAPADPGQVASAMRAAIAGGMSRSAAAAQVATDLGVSRREAYQLSLKPGDPSSEANPGGG